MKCTTCGIECDNSNCAPSYVKRGRGYCRTCANLQSVNWRNKHKGISTQWRNNNLEKRRKYEREWAKKHYPQRKLRFIKFITDNPEYQKLYQRRYRREKADKVRVWMKKTISRRRGISVNFVYNNYFKGSHFHHMGNGKAMYIPGELHRSVSHSLTRNKNMEKINDKAIEWFGAINKVL